MYSIKIIITVYHFSNHERNSLLPLPSPSVHQTVTQTINERSVNRSSFLQRDSLYVIEELSVELNMSDSDDGKNQVRVHQSICESKHVSKV